MSNQWYTPPEILYDAREVLGGPIQFDPASCAKANGLGVHADEFWTKDDDFLDRSREVPEVDRAWMNPPYSNAGPFVRRLVDEWDDGVVGSAIILLHNATGTNWWQPLWRFPMCFFDYRVKFHDEDLVERTSPRYQNVAVLLPGRKSNGLLGRGEPPESMVLDFDDVFSKHGHVTNLRGWV